LATTHRPLNVDANVSDPEFAQKALGEQGRRRIGRSGDHSAAHVETGVQRPSNGF
jgi:hypothetical protein